jgi:DNA repair protein RadC
MSKETELLDTVLGKVGIGERLISRWGDMVSLSRNLDASGLSQKQKAVLQACFTVSFLKEKNVTEITCPEDIRLLCSEMSILGVEHLDVLVLNTRNKLIERVNVYRGSVNSSQVRMAEIFREAIVRKSCAIVLVHNHPSGDSTPSADDVSLTRAAVAAGKILDVDVLDHVIIGENGRYCSLKERGLGFS